MVPALLFLFHASCFAQTELLHPPLEESVELHAHLFMEEGMPILQRGKFNEPPRSDHWKTRFGSNATKDTVLRSGIRILVVSFYANPFFGLDLRESIRKQIALTEKFVSENPEWVIARGAAEAMAAIQKGKRILILSIEGANGIIETDEDIKEFIDDKGVRIVTLLHFMNDRFGGPAFMHQHLTLLNPFAFLKSLVSHHESEGARANPMGLTEEGKAMTRKLIQRGVWIDLSHSSDASHRDLLPILREAGQPMLYTHIALRKYRGAERALAQWQLDELAKSGGILGLMPCHSMLHDTPPIPKPTSCSGHWDEDEQSLLQVAQQYQEIAAKIGPESIVMGSDFNGAMDHLAPTCGTGTSLDQRGFVDIGQTSDYWTALRTVQPLVPQNLKITVDRFLQTWSRVKP